MIAHKSPQAAICSAIEIMTVGEASRASDLSPDRVRQLDRAGVLPAQRTETGVRFFARTVVEEFRRKREARKAK